MNGKKFFIGVLAAVVALLAVTASVSAGVIGQEDEQVRGIAEPILDNVLEGMARKDYRQYTRDFDAMLKESVTKERFAEIQKDITGQFGDYLFREYLGFLNREAFTIILWKGVFAKDKEEVLIKLVVSENNGTYTVTGLWYQ